MLYNIILWLMLMKQNSELAQSSNTESTHPPCSATSHTPSQAIQAMAEQLRIDLDNFPSKHLNFGDFPSNSSIYTLNIPKPYRWCD